MSEYEVSFMADLIQDCAETVSDEFASIYNSDRNLYNAGHYTIGVTIANPRACIKAPKIAAENKVEFLVYDFHEITALS